METFFTKSKQVLLAFLFCVNIAFPQHFTIPELVQFPSVYHEDLSSKLLSKGWNNHNFEMISDSNFNRRTWMKQNIYDELKSYFILYEYITDTSENHVIYQFSDRNYFNKCKQDLKGMGYKKAKNKDKKKSKEDKNIHKETVEIYYSDKLNSLFVFKDVFFYGMNTFLITSYRMNSAMGKNIKNNSKT